MGDIHPTAIVDRRAELADGVSIGAYSIIDGPVRIGKNSAILPHTHVAGKTVIGSDCRIGPTAFIGLPPQHLRADQEIGQTIIGDRVVLREMVSVHRSTSAGDDHATRIGDDCFFMGAAHVAHDCVIGAGVIAANGALLGGHCDIAPKVFLGGGCTLHQFVRVGRLAMIAGNEATSQDVPPFASFRYGGLKGYNAIGCKRDGWNQETIRGIRAVYRVLHNQRVMSEAVRIIRETVPDLPQVREMLDFISQSKRGIVPSLAQRNVAGRLGISEGN